MEPATNDDKFIHEIMLKSKLQVPFSDFDDSVMHIINLKKLKLFSLKREFRLSWVFFILGSVFGIAISAILPTIQSSIMGLPLNKFTLPFQTLFAFLFISQLDNLLHIYKKHFLKKTYS
jgi:hypothetical protein